MTNNTWGCESVGMIVSISILQLRDAHVSKASEGMMPMVRDENAHK